MFLCIKDICVLILEREKERQTDRQTLMWEINLDLLPLVCASTRDWTCNLGMFPDQESNPQAFGVWIDSPRKWNTWPGLLIYFPERNEVFFVCNLRRHFCLQRWEKNTSWTSRDWVITEAQELVIIPASWDTHHICSSGKTVDKNVPYPCSEASPISSRNF